MAFWGYFSGPPLTVVSSSVQKVYPGFIRQGTPHPFIANNRKIEWFDTFMDACERKKAKRICFVRTYAMGDIIMLLPIIRALRRDIDLEVVKIACREGFWESLRGWSGQDSFEFVRWDYGQSNGYECDLSIDLDQALEIDHWGGWASELHRCVLYGKALGLEVSV